MTVKEADKEKSSHFPFHLDRAGDGGRYLEGGASTLWSSLSLGLSATPVDETMRM